MQCDRVVTGFAGAFGAPVLGAAMKLEILDGGVRASAVDGSGGELVRDHDPRSYGFRVFKRAVDVMFAVAALPSIGVLWVLLAVLNPVFNPGPVFFRQARMGKDGRAFTVVKFRTMLPSDDGLRAYDAALEDDRITPFGRLLRTYRIDEIPNFINVLRGEMSLIGPRPDAYDHARIYADTVPRYRLRYKVKPGITGLAQVRSGYAETARAVQRKARWDNFYVENRKLSLDGYILLQTLRVIATGFGAK